MTDIRRRSPLVRAADLPYFGPYAGVDNPGMEAELRVADNAGYTGVREVVGRSGRFGVAVAVNRCATDGHPQLDQTS